MKKIISQVFPVVSLIIIIFVCFTYGKSVNDEFQYTSDFAKYQNSLNKFIHDAKSRSMIINSNTHFYIKSLDDNWSNGFEEIENIKGVEHVIDKASFKLSNSTVSADFNKITISNSDSSTTQEITFRYTGHRNIYSNVIEISDGKITAELI